MWQPCLAEGNCSNNPLNKLFFWRILWSKIMSYVSQSQKTSTVISKGIIDMYDLRLKYLVCVLQVTLRKNSSEGTPPFMRKDSGDDQGPISSKIVIWLIFIMFVLPFGQLFGLIIISVKRTIRFMPLKDYITISNFLIFAKACSSQRMLMNVLKSESWVEYGIEG